MPCILVAHDEAAALLVARRPALAVRAVPMPGKTRVGLLLLIRADEVHRAT